MTLPIATALENQIDSLVLQGCGTAMRTDLGLPIARVETFTSTDWRSGPDERSFAICPIQAHTVAGLRQWTFPDAIGTPIGVSVYAAWTIIDFP